MDVTISTSEYEPKLKCKLVDKDNFLTSWK